jgi:phage baseplate assembly protein W
MPLQRVSKGFKDISLSFQVNPINYDLISISNETAISRAVRNLVFTKRGERPFDALLGSRVSSLLFDNLDPITASNIELEISTVIQNYEPRVSLVRTKATPNYDANEIDVEIVYNIIGVDVPQQQLEFALQPTR